MELDVHGNQCFKLHLKFIFRSRPGRDLKVEPWRFGVRENGGQGDEQTDTETANGSCLQTSRTFWYQSLQELRHHPSSRIKLFQNTATYCRTMEIYSYGSGVGEVRVQGTRWFESGEGHLLRGVAAPTQGRRTKCPHNWGRGRLRQFSEACLVGALIPFHVSRALVALSLFQCSPLHNIPWRLTSSLRTHARYVWKAL